MKTRITIFITLIATFFLFAEDMITWDKHYGDIYSDWAGTIVQTSDGGYVFGGSSTYQISEDWYAVYALMYKVDSLGDSLWQLPYAYAGGPTSSFRSIIETYDGNIVALGRSEIESRVYAAFLLKLDQSGNVLWEKVYSHGESMSAFSLTETADHGLAVCGDSDLNDSVSVGIIMKFDENGDSLWTTELRNDGYSPLLDGYNNDLSSIVAISDNSCIAVGDNSDRNGSDSWIVRLNESGDTIFNIDCGDTTVGDVYRSIDVCNDGFYAAGEKVVGSKGNTDIYVVKFNLFGDTVWTKLYGFPNGSWEDTYCVSTTKDNGCIITGETGGEFDNMFLLKLDENGDSLWTKIYEPKYRPVNAISATGISVKQTFDDGFIVCGQGFENDDASYDMWVLKLDEAGNLSGIINNEQLIINNYALHQNYPNPFNNMTTIEYALQDISEIEINIYNTKGQFVQNLVDTKQGKGSYNILFNAGKLNSGVYYYRLEVDGVVKETKKMLYLR